MRGRGRGLGRGRRRATTARKRRAILVAACLLCSPALVSRAENPALASEPLAPFEFALVGDYPYFPRDDAGMPHLLADLARAPELAWILHLGDLHNPRATACSEALFRARRDAFLALGRPFVLTPGDNDWADCDGDGAAWLASLREVFFGDARRVLAGSGLDVRSQGRDGGVVENLLWEREGVVFATLHMVAGGTPLFGLFDPVADEREALREAGVAWLDEAFRRAHAQDARAVFLATQISLWPYSGNPTLMHVLEPDHLEAPDGFGPFLASLVRHTRAFGRPVVLANGDTHVFRVDKPLVDEHRETQHNFTRVEGFGSPQGHWVRVRVEPDREEVFSFRQEWVSENLYTLVPRELRTDGFEDDGIGVLIYVVRTLQWIPTLLACLGAFVVVRWIARRLSRAR